MGAMRGSVLPCPLTATRDFVERELYAARAQSTPCGFTGRVRADARRVALNCVPGQVRSS